MEFKRFKLFENKNWLGLFVAWIFGFILLAHSILDNFLLARNAGFDLFFNGSEILVGLFLTLLGIFQGDLIDKLDRIGDRITS